MKNRIVLAAGAGAAGVVLAMLGLSDRPEPPASGMVVVTEPAVAPETADPPIASALAPRLPQSISGAEQVVDAATSDAPANYAYYESSDPGVWATPAQFSEAK